MAETCFAFERKAREMGEDATLSVRQLRRWMEGRTDRPRPVSRRVAEEFWGHSLEALLSPLDGRTLNVVPEDQLQLPSVGHPHPELGLHEVGETTDRRRMLQAFGGVVASAGLSSRYVPWRGRRLRRENWLGCSLTPSHLGSSAR
jgi:hypothetical protein